MNETITSSNNAKLKELRKLQDRKQRDRSGAFAAEGEDMLSAALAAGLQPLRVFYDEDARDRIAAGLNGLDAEVELHPVRGDVLASSSVLGSGSRLISVWPQRWVALNSLQADRPLLYLHAVSDPGNVGTIMRAVSAFGGAGVVLSRETADPFAPKAVRASMGAVFSVGFARADFDLLGQAIGDRRTVALVPGSGSNLADAALAPTDVIVLGAEREGLPDRISRSCAEIAHIPLDPGGAESLNVAMAATLCLYETTLHRLPPEEGRLSQ